MIVSSPIPPSTVSKLTLTLQHDAVLDYYGRRLATCSSDKSINIFDIEGDSHRLTETLKGHDGAVWSLSWAHPKFSTLLASSSYSGQILIHREAGPGQWQLIHASTTHSASVNTVSWAPHEAGCLLAAASSDGTVSLLELAGAGGANPAGAVPGQHAQSAFVQIAHFPAHSLGANSVSWAPAQAPGALTSSTPQTAPATKRFVTGGSDCAVKIWELQGAGEPALVCQLDGHTDWVRDVSWSSTVLRKSYIASASQDRTVRIWTSENGGMCFPP
jgi:protein transport protein SEC13